MRRLKRSRKEIERARASVFVKAARKCPIPSSDFSRNGSMYLMYPNLSPCRKVSPDRQKTAHLRPDTCAPMRMGTDAL